MTHTPLLDTTHTPSLPARSATSRRTALRAGLALGGAALVPGSVLLDQRPSAAARPMRTTPFTLGVASGDPEPDGFVIWTRLALDPLAPDGKGGMPSSTYTMRWQVAADPRFTTIVKSGTVAAQPNWAHSVHVEVHGLKPGRPYWYRFRADQYLSPTGRSVTTAAANSSPSELRMAFASCSNFPAGYFTAYAALAAEQPDVILHLGDYMYEGPGDGVGRNHVGPETTTLANYRQRYAQYKTDPDLQAAHAAAPWLVVWDDHEVDNNYADDIPEKPADQATFVERRAAAYKAYYENMPLRTRSVPRGPDLDLYRRAQWGDLATLHMLDTRQYRSDQACGDGYKACAEAEQRADRSLPGQAQERWLLDGFAASRARWDILGQQVFFARRDNDARPEVKTVSMDAWDGYPHSRDRLARGWSESAVRNAVVLTGDVHAHWASDLYLDYDNPAPGPVGSELVTSSITSGKDGYDEPTGTHPWAAWNPHLRFWTNLRGYVSTTITPREMTARFRCVPLVSTPGAEAFTRATFVIEDGQPGLQQTSDTPAATRPGSTRAKGLQAPRRDVDKIADTIAAETHSGG